MNDTKLQEKLTKYFKKNKHFPGFVCQETMMGFKEHYEVKSFWINGEFKYYVAMKAADKVFSESKIYGSNPEEFGKVSPKVLKQIKGMGRKVVDLFPKMNPHSEPPLYLRIDFGCCIENKNVCREYFINEIEYMPNLFCNEIEFPVIDEMSKNIIRLSNLKK